MSGIRWEIIIECKIEEVLQHIDNWLWDYRKDGFKFGDKVKITIELVKKRKK